MQLRYDLLIPGRRGNPLQMAIPTRETISRNIKMEKKDFCKTLMLMEFIFWLTCMHYRNSQGILWP